MVCTLQSGQILIDVENIIERLKITLLTDQILIGAKNTIKKIQNSYEVSNIPSLRKSSVTLLRIGYVLNVFLTKTRSFCVQKCLNSAIFYITFSHFSNPPRKVFFSLFTYFCVIFSSLSVSAVKITFLILSIYLTHRIFYKFNIRNSVKVKDD